MPFLNSAWSPLLHSLWWLLWVRLSQPPPPASRCPAQRPQPIPLVDSHGPDLASHSHAPLNLFLGSRSPHMLSPAWDHLPPSLRPCRWDTPPQPQALKPTTTWPTEADPASQDCEASGTGASPPTLSLSTQRPYDRPLGWPPPAAPPQLHWATPLSGGGGWGSGSVDEPSANSASSVKIFLAFVLFKKP